MRLKSFILGLVAAAVAAVGAAGARPLELTDYLQWRSAGGAQISPDGRRILYRVSAFDPLKDGPVSEVWIMNSDGGDARPFELNGGGYRWAPGSDRIAYTASDGNGSQVFVLDMTRDDAAPRSITSGLSLQPSQLAWSRDGRFLAFTGRVDAPSDDFTITLPAKPEGATWTADATVIDDLHYRGITGSLRTPGRRHLFVVSAEGGEARQVTHGDWDVGARFSGMAMGGTPAWTPDGGSLVFDGLTRPDSFADYRYSDINIVDLATGAIRQINPVRGFWTGPQVSPDGRRVAYSGYGDNPSTWPPRQLRVVGIDGDGDRVLVPDLPDDPSSIEWGPDGEGLYYVVNVEGSTHLHYVSLDGEQRVVTTGDQRLFVGSYGGGYATATRETPYSGYNIARIELATGAVTPLTDLNATLLDDIDLATMEGFWFSADDGQRVQGWLIKPANFDPSRRYPMVLDVHGGPHSLYGHGFDFRYQDFAANGYVVLLVNPRGSTGYGSAFANAIDRAFPGDIDTGDLLSGVDAAVAKGFIDPERLFVMGCSGGGSLTAFLTARTNRFKAAAVLCPVSDWVSMAGTTDVAAWAYAQFERPFWEDPEPWFARSPLMQVGRVETPTLVMVGDKDFRTPVGQAEQYYSALRMRNVPTRLVILKGETHQPWKGAPSNFIRSQLYLRTWFARYGGPPVEEP